VKINTIKYMKYSYVLSTVYIILLIYCLIAFPDLLTGIAFTDKSSWYWWIFLANCLGLQLAINCIVTKIVILFNYFKQRSSCSD